MSATCDVKASVIYTGESFHGVIYIQGRFTDTLDLRPHNHAKDDFSLLLNPGEDPFDAATILLGFIYHDLLGRRDDIKIKAICGWKQAIAGNIETGLE